jgi:hypothetical protein
MIQFATVHDSDAVAQLCDEIETAYPGVEIAEFHGFLFRIEDTDGTEDEVFALLEQHQSIAWVTKDH